VEGDKGVPQREIDGVTMSAVMHAGKEKRDVGPARSGLCFALTGHPGTPALQPGPGSASHCSRPPLGSPGSSTPSGSLGPCLVFKKFCKIF